MQNSILGRRSFTFLILHFAFAAIAIAQTGGTYTINQSVIASGGQNSAGGSYTVAGTVGQSTAGTSSTSGNYAVRGGFWTFDALAPSAAEVSVGGRVRTSNGIGIRNARVTLTASNGAIQTAVTSSFGYYRFENIPVGETCVISVSSKRFTFAQSTVVRSIFEEISDLDFIADFNELLP